MRIDRRARIPLLFLSLLIVVAPSLGQISNHKKLSTIPPQLRERFVERLNLYFDLKRTQQYAKLYELLSEAYSGVTREKPTKEDFIKKYEELDEQGRNVVPLKWKLTKVIKSLDDRGNETYFVFADVKGLYGGRKVDDEAYFEARVENGDWYFREYYFQI